MRIEQLILENLIYDSQYASLVGVFLKPEYFRAHPEKIVFREIQNHIKEYNKSPSVSSLANIISERDDLNENLFKNCLEILKAYKKKSDDTEWLIHETEKWAKDAAVYNGIVDSIAILEGKDTKKPKDAIPDM
jgi:replicative DNA helicase